MIIIFTPVIGSQDLHILKYYGYGFFNAVKALPKRGTLNTIPEYPLLWADSGGLQISLIEKDLKEGVSSKRWMVIPGVGIRDTQEWLIIDPIELCRRCGRLDVRFAMTLDFPISGDPTRKEFLERLNKSYLWAKLMVKNRPRYCPNTEVKIIII